LEQLANLRVSLQARQNLNKDERGLIMSLSPVYERWKEETLQKGIQEGEQEQRRKLLEAALASRFGAVDAEMASLIPTMAQLSDAELAGLMLRMANLSREELLERFGR
jgi:predicted transposase YdaD